MKRSRLTHFAAGLASVLMILPPPVVAAPSGPGAAVTDVALHDHGVLIGQVVRPDGAAVAGVPVSLALHGTVVASAMTDDQGAFQLHGLRGGVYQLTAAGAYRNYRLWAPQTAPPAARDTAMLVAGHQVARGQSPTGGRRFWTRPLLIGGLVATAVAVPLAVHNHNSHTNLVTE